MFDHEGMNVLVSIAMVFLTFFVLYFKQRSKFKIWLRDEKSSGFDLYFKRICISNIISSNGIDEVFNRYIDLIKKGKKVEPSEFIMEVADKYIGNVSHSSHAKIGREIDPLFDIKIACEEAYNKFMK